MWSSQEIIINVDASITFSTAVFISTLSTLVSATLFWNCLPYWNSSKGKNYIYVSPKVLRHAEGTLLKLHQNEDMRDHIMRMEDIRCDWIDHTEWIWYEIYVKQILKYTANEQWDLGTSQRQMDQV